MCSYGDQVDRVNRVGFEVAFVVKPGIKSLVALPP